MRLNSSAGGAHNNLRRPLRDRREPRSLSSHRVLAAERVLSASKLPCMLTAPRRGPCGLSAHTGNLDFCTRRSVTERTKGSESRLPMMGIFRMKPLRARSAWRAREWVGGGNAACEAWHGRACRRAMAGGRRHARVDGAWLWRDAASSLSLVRKRVQSCREEVAKEIEESPPLDDDADHRPPVEHQRDAAEEAGGALGLSLLEEESVRFRRSDDKHHAGEKEQLRTAHEFARLPRIVSAKRARVASQKYSNHACTGSANAHCPLRAGRGQRT